MTDTKNDMNISSKTFIPPFRCQIGARQQIDFKPKGQQYKEIFLEQDAPLYVHSIKKRGSYTPTPLFALDQIKLMILLWCKRFTFHFSQAGQVTRHFAFFKTC